MHIFSVHVCVSPCPFVRGVYVCDRPCTAHPQYIQYTNICSRILIRHRKKNNIKLLRTLLFHYLSLCCFRIICTLDHLLLVSLCWIVWTRPLFGLCWISHSNERKGTIMHGIHSCWMKDGMGNITMQCYWEKRNWNDEFQPGKGLFLRRLVIVDCGSEFISEFEWIGNCN